MQLSSIQQIRLLKINADEIYCGMANARLLTEELYTHISEVHFSAHLYRSVS